jgi:serine/threonine protein kinase
MRSTMHANATGSKERERARHLDLAALGNVRDHGGVNAGQSHPWGPARDGASTGLIAGDHLDRYELLCPLAQGGMAAVWLARLHGKHGFQKLFAIKTILPQFAEDVRFQQMFLDEARIAAGISHPFVAQILDLGEERGILYIVMEWVDGDSLAKLMRTVARAQQWFPLNIALRICADVAGALHAAHELHDSSGQPLGVVHRDVSPSNILLSSKGSPKVIDFGIAKAIGRLTQETSAGMLKGKVMYMAPEQATGRTTDRRADVWALASVLHTMLAGEPPFTGDNEMQTLHRLTGGGPPNPLPSNVPPEVAAIIGRALHPDMEQRTPTCAKLQHELEEVLIKLHMATTAVDVATFAAHYLAATDVARHDTVQHALDMAAARAQSGPPGVSGSSSGIAERARMTGSGQPLAAPMLDASSYPNQYASASSSSIAAQAAPPHMGSSPPAPAYSAPVYPSQSKMSAVNVPFETSSAAGTAAAPAVARTPAWVLIVGGLFALAVLATIGITVGSHLARRGEAPSPETTSAPLATTTAMEANPVATAEPEPPPSIVPAASAAPAASVVPEPTPSSVTSPSAAPVAPLVDTPAGSAPTPPTTSSAHTTRNKPAHAAHTNANAPDFGF